MTDGDLVSGWVGETLYSVPHHELCVLLDRGTLATADTTFPGVKSRCPSGEGGSTGIQLLRTEADISQTNGSRCLTKKTAALKGRINMVYISGIPLH